MRIRKTEINFRRKDEMKIFGKDKMIFRARVSGVTWARKNGPTRALLYLKSIEE